MGERVVIKRPISSSDCNLIVHIIVGADRGLEGGKLYYFGPGPRTSRSSMVSQEDVVAKSPYYVDPARMTPLQKHCAFFDRNGDGILMPWETFAGFCVLGYGMAMSLLGTLLVHLFFSYWTLPSWVPDPFFPIYIKNVDRLKHGSDSGLYDYDGTLKPVVGDGVQTLIGRFDEDAKGGLGLLDMYRMTQRKWNVLDFFGWWATKLEWFFLWVLAQRHGVVSWDAIRDQYDGTLFRKVEASRAPNATASKRAH